MPANPFKSNQDWLSRVRLAHAAGTSIACATCNRYHEGRDQGLQGHACTERRPCASPFGGDVFQHYEGKLTDDAFVSMCFVCGNHSAHTVQITGRNRRLGLCDEHRPMLDRIDSARRSAMLMGRAVVVTNLRTGHTQAITPKDAPDPATASLQGIMHKIMWEEAHDKHQRQANIAHQGLPRILTEGLGGDHIKPV